MRKRKSPRVVWLPPTNANSPLINPTSGIQIFSVDISGVAPSAVGEIPLTIDAQSDPLDPNTSLADVESSGYRLRRIVGKIWVGADPTDDQSGFEAAVVTAGIIVRRADETTGQSYALTAGLVNMLAPADIQNYGDPWVWRRSWLMTNQNFNTVLPDFGQSNSFFSALDGPHVDQKTARIVSSEERLFLDVGVMGIFGPNGVGQINWNFKVISDLRCLASLRTSSGNRRNASR